MRKKFFWVLFAANVLLSVLASFFIARTAYQQAQERFSSRLNQGVRALERQIFTARTDDDFAQLVSNPSVDRFERDHQLELGFYLNGRFVARTQRYPKNSRQFGERLPAMVIDSCLTRRLTLDLSDPGLLMNPRFAIYGPLQGPHGKRGIWEVSVPQEDVAEVAEQVVTYGLLILVIGLLISMLVAVYLSRWLARPLESMAEDARALGRGDFDRVKRTTFHRYGNELDLVQERLAEAAETSRQAETFRQMIVHDLKNPLAIIQTSIGLTVRPDRTVDLEVAPRTLPPVRHATERIVHMLADFLDQEKYRKGKFPATIDPFSLSEFFREAVENWTPVVEHGGKHLMQIGDCPEVRVLGDRALCRRILDNLLENAMKFTPRGGEVHLGASADANEVIFWVQDTGSGIPEKALPRIFEPYYQAEARRAFGLPSLGLGLGFCKLAAEAQGGQILVSSPPSEGARFAVRLPVVP